VSVNNPALGNTYSNVRFDFTVQNAQLSDIAAFEYTDGTNWYSMPLTQSGSDVTGYYGPFTGFPMPAPYTATSLFRITLNTAKTYPITIQLNDVSGAPVTLATMTNAATVLPGKPVITGIVDVDSCAQSGVQINYTPGLGAVSHTLVVDNTVLVPNFNSGDTYNPSGTAAHTYVVRAVATNPALVNDSAGVSGTDINDTPQAATSVSVTNPDCSGAMITFTDSPDAQSYELLVDGTAVVTPFVSGGMYTPADGLAHNYVVRAIKNACHADSAPVAFAVTNLTPPRVTDSLMVTKSGNNMLLSWALILPASVVDRYEVGRFSPPVQPGDPPVFEAVIGTATGQVNGIQVDLNGEPSSALYLVRAVKGTCYGPWE
jgi:hypothetical protein